MVCNPDLPPGTCNLGECWKQRQYISGYVQMLTNDLINDAHARVWGHCNIPFYDTRIEVRRANTETMANAADVFGVAGDFAFPLNDVVTANKNMRWIGSAPGGGRFIWKRALALLNGCRGATAQPPPTGK